MSKITTFLYTLVDEETGELADIAAPNESAARLWLGGGWILPERCPLFAAPAEVADWDRVVKEAQSDADLAFANMNAARPKPGSITTTQVLQTFNEATAEFDRKKARVAKLLKISAALA
jgi:hypothetical protein